jgi:hypothetical protein
MPAMMAAYDGGVGEPSKGYMVKLPCEAEHIQPLDA